MIFNDKLKYLFTLNLHLKQFFFCFLYLIKKKFQSIFNAIDVN